MSVNNRAPGERSLSTYTRATVMWIIAAVGGALSVLTGLVPAESAVDALVRVAPVLVFLVAVTVLAELCDAAGVFDFAARKAAQAARGHTRLLFILTVGLATATTVMLSLDTTAVLFTPVVLAMCAQLDLDPLPFAMATVWLANTTSLLLPVSNLTNLLAVGRLDLGTLGFAERMWPPTLAAAAVTTAVLLLLYRRRLRGRYSLPGMPQISDRLLFLICATSCALFTVLILAEVNVTVAAVTCAGPPLVGFAVRQRNGLRWSLVPWRLVFLVAGLFLIVEAAYRHGLDRALNAAAGAGGSSPDLLRLAATAVGGANAVNNLPAYLALEPVTTGSQDRLLALLIGVNAGPLLLVWGSLATLLWRDRCRARGVHISGRGFAAAGLLLVPVVVPIAVLALQLT